LEEKEKRLVFEPSVAKSDAASVSCVRCKAAEYQKHEKKGGTRNDDITNSNHQNWLSECFGKCTSWTAG